MARALLPNLRLGRAPVVANIGSRDGVSVLSLHPGWIRTDMSGPEAAVPVDRSAQGLRNVIASAKIEGSGSFLTFASETVDR